jgi:hypothetical protein
MKAIHEFDLSNPEDAYEYELHNNARKYCVALCEVDRMLRDLMKHVDMTDEVYNRLELIRQEIPESIN